ncbi:MAG: diacylglycerol/lipid kinase family protein [Limisphaerales bacterium]|jgi:diacylglycerol kinase (ATP)
MRKISIICNPAAGRQKASLLQEYLSSFRGEYTFLKTEYPSHAMELAAQAAQSEVDCVVAMGGDGTIYEVVNGLMKSGAERLPSMGVIPSGTANVFALEHRLPLTLQEAWNAVEEGRTRLIDLIEVKESFATGEDKERIRYIIQLAGAGFDAESLKLLNFGLKKKIGKLAYWVAAFQALLKKRPSLVCEWEGRRVSCDCALIGNGRYYGGRHVLFPNAKTDDGLLDVTFFPKINPFTAFQLFLKFCSGANLCLKENYTFQTQQVNLQGENCSFQLEGDLAGNLPVSFRVAPQRLPVIVSARPGKGERKTG